MHAGQDGWSGWSGYSAAALSMPDMPGLHGLTRGAPVLRWAAERLREDKALVCFLVWANPSNLRFASPALQADAEVVAAALASPFYAEPPPPVPPTCVLRFAAEELRAGKEVVLAAVARSGYEFEFAGDALRADAYVAAWAGAPVGAAPCRELSKTFTRLLKSDLSVEYMDANWRALSEDKDFLAICGGERERVKDGSQCALAEAIIRSWRCRSWSCCLSRDTVLFSVAASPPPVSFTEGESIFFITLCAA
jgi:hypothetical protein